MLKVTFLRFLFVILTIVFFNSQVWGQQPVPVIIALNSEMNRYRHLAEYAVQVSLNISVLVTKMTEEVFMKSDEIESWAMQVEDEVTAKAQEVSPKSLKSADCVQNLLILRSIKDMRAHVKESTKCLHDEANINAMFETMLTTTLNHHRSHVMEGRRAMENCAQTAGPTYYTKCLNIISKELKDTETKTISTMKKIQNQTTKRRNYLTRKMRICELLSSKFVETLRRNLDELKRCA